MQAGRSALNRSLDPDYDPDDEIPNPPYEAPRHVEKAEEDFPESPKKPNKAHIKGESASSSDFWVPQRWRLCLCYYDNVLCLYYYKDANVNVDVNATVISM